MKNGSVDIDGRSFSGRDISINSNGKVIVDGIEQDGQLVGNVTVTVNGDAESIHNGSAALEPVLRRARRRCVAPAAVTGGRPLLLLLLLLLFFHYLLESQL